MGKGPETLIHKGDLAAITEAASAVDSFIATVNWLVANQTLTADIGSIFVLALEASRDKLEPAIVANTHN